MRRRLTGVLLTAALVAGPVPAGAADDATWEYTGAEALVAGEAGRVEVALSLSDPTFPPELPIGYAHFLLSFDPENPQDATPMEGVEVTWTRGDASGTVTVDADGGFVVPDAPFRRQSTPALGTPGGDQHTLELALPAGDYVLFSDLVDRSPPTSRIAGDDRYATAAAASARFFPPDVELVYVASGEGFADALSAGPAAAHRQAPLLLAARDVLPRATRDELRRLAPDRIIVVGGEVAISDDVFRELAPYAGSVRRIGGADRYDTAARIAANAWGDADLEAAYVASGEGFADALGASAQAARDDVPVLLVARDRVPAPTASALDDLQVEAVTVAGGVNAVSIETVAALRAQVGRATRRSGPDRYATSAALVTDDRTGRALLVATGESFPDGLTAGSLAQRLDADLLLTRPDEVPEVIVDRAEQLAPRRIYVLGGTTALSQSTLATFDGLRTPLTPLYLEPVVQPGGAIDFTVE